MFNSIWDKMVLPVTCLYHMEDMNLIFSAEYQQLAFISDNSTNTIWYDMIVAILNTTKQKNFHPLFLLHKVIFNCCQYNKASIMLMMAAYTYMHNM